MKITNFPRVRITHGPTPLEFMPRMTEALGGPNLYIKRDDCTGLGSGGNKTRKLEFLMADAVKHGALLRNGVGVGVASQILGHRDQTMLLRRYGHLDHMSLQDAQHLRWQLVSASTARLNPTWSLACD
jgi:hypothetical protein